MKLITKTLEKRFVQVGSQTEEKDPLILVIFGRSKPIHNGTRLPPFDTRCK